MLLETKLCLNQHKLRRKRGKIFLSWVSWPFSLVFHGYWYKIKNEKHPSVLNCNDYFLRIGCQLVRIPQLTKD